MSISEPTILHDDQNRNADIHQKDQLLIDKAVREQTLYTTGMKKIDNHHDRTFLGNLTYALELLRVDTLRGLESLKIIFNTEA